MESSTSPAPRPTIATFYLPQFHPIPENDAFWGSGFTEWRNVAQARPVFNGHEQPRYPKDLGYYDLRCRETQAAQATLAKTFGIGAFCYYHYWFAGKRLLHRPIEQVLEDRFIDVPFFLCWANENWTRKWDGRAGETLISQSYSEDDDIRHIQSLIRIFRDPRYFRIAEKPVMLVYRTRLLPNPRRTAQIWREEVYRAGLSGLHLCAVESMSGERGDPTEIGFDAAVEFQPDWQNLGSPINRTRLRRLRQAVGLRSPWYDHRVFNYESVVSRMQDRDDVPYLRYGCVTPRWDNSPRRSSDATILYGSTPHLYEQWLNSALERAKSRSHDLVFINAWNEWAEGAYLEPDLTTGTTYLEATRRAIDNSRRGNVAG